MAATSVKSHTGNVDKLNGWMSSGLFITVSIESVGLEVTSTVCCWTQNYVNQPLHLVGVFSSLAHDKMAKHIYTVWCKQVLLGKHRSVSRACLLVSRMQLVVFLWLYNVH